MTVKLQFYRCPICKNLVQILHEGEGSLICCGQEMDLLQAKTDEQMAEKHVPKFMLDEDGSEFIQVGSIPHPMTDEHYIEFIETVSDDKNLVSITFLYPNQEPKKMLNNSVVINKAYEYCNLHGLWEGKRD